MRGDVRHEYVCFLGNSVSGTVLDIANKTAKACFLPFQFIN